MQLTLQFQPRRGPNTYRPRRLPLHYAQIESPVKNLLPGGAGGLRPGWGAPSTPEQPRCLPGQRRPWAESRRRKRKASLLTPFAPALADVLRRPKSTTNRLRLIAAAVISGCEIRIPFLLICVPFRDLTVREVISVKQRAVWVDIDVVHAHRSQDNRFRRCSTD